MNKYFSWSQAVVCIVLPACSSVGEIKDANLGDETKGKVMTADYRWIMSRPHTETKKTIVCTELSPDVAKAISTALARSAEVALTQPSGQTIGVNQALQYQTAQSIAQRGRRFATIQLLRDILYHDCLAAPRILSSNHVNVRNNHER